MTKTHLLTPVIALFAFAVVFSACTSQQPAAEAIPTSAPVQETSIEAAPTLAEEASPGADSMTAEGKTITDTGAYTSPGGPETIEFTIVVDNEGVITEAKAVPQGTNPTTKIRQGAFAAEVGKVMVGKNLNEITKVDRIGGSSLTTGAFNTFLAAAKAQL
jgi:hypothetical protein